MRQTLRKLIAEHIEKAADDGAYLMHTDAILDLPEMKTQQQFADKWASVLAGDAELIEQYTQRTGKAMAVFVRARADLLRITDGLMVDENCKSLAHGVEENEMIPFCSLCDGTGHTSRPAAAPELREFLEHFFRPANTVFHFKDGRTLRMDFPYV